ncbi:MAG: protein-glutamate O-methyltransferase CheR [Candidatus Sedimenticola endophacoides]
MTIDAQLSRRDYQAFQAFLQEACGIALGECKEYLVSSSLRPLLIEQGLALVGELLQCVAGGGRPGLVTAIIDAMTTNETYWFCDNSHFTLLAEMVLPALREQGRERLRVWSAACSSGQEPYNVSMVAWDYLRRWPGCFPQGVEVLATDISNTMLEEARRGVYRGLSAARGLSSEQRQRYFIPHGDDLEVRPEIRRRVTFRGINLTKSFWSLGRFDVVFCRNVLIYFTAEQKRDIIGRIAAVLNPGGYLFLGSTESLSKFSDQFEVVRQSGGIAYRLERSTGAVS